MEKQTKQTELNWLDTEIADQQSKQLPTGEKLPKLKLEPKKITEVKVDMSEPFRVWNDPNKGTAFAIIKVKHDNIDKVWFLNKSNPIYREILQGLKNKQTTFKVLRVGTLADTKYEIIE